jgi:methylenetetrahydrofolate dehydrogenase (NADP+) / methenyltetrahydrofolate cyclohydrolase
MTDTGSRLDGAGIARKIRDEVAEAVTRIGAAGWTPRLDAVLVGDDPASKLYVASKARTCQELGMAANTHHLPADSDQGTVEELVRRLNDDPDVDGILVQLPLPAGLDTHRVLDLIDPLKDVDGIHPANVGLLQQGRPRLVPCTPAGIMQMLRREGVQLEGRRAVVVGRSDIVGKPMAVLLLHAHATVTICHSRTRELARITREADVLVAAAGRCALIGPEHVREGAVVVDVGQHRLTDGDVVRRLFADNPKKLGVFERKGAVLAGDVDFDRVAPVAGRITPVPGGVGPLTIAMLMANTVTAARLRRGAEGVISDLGQ